MDIKAIEDNNVRLISGTLILVKEGISSVIGIIYIRGFILFCFWVVLFMRDYLSS